MDKINNEKHGGQEEDKMKMKGGGYFTEIGLLTLGLQLELGHSFVFFLSLFCLLFIVGLSVLTLPVVFFVFALYLAVLSV